MIIDCILYVILIFIFEMVSPFFHIDIFIFSGDFDIFEIYESFFA